MKKLSVFIAIFLMSLITLGALFHAMGFRINLTESIPIGLYRITSAESLKNAYVIFCPDDRESFRLAKSRGYIDHGLNCGGYGYLMKKVVAVSGDILSVTPEGVLINQTLLPFSKPKLKDGINRTLPQWRILDYPLKVNEVMTMTSQSEWSFDGRYYGLVHTRQIKGMIIPIWVINKREKTT
ncbi:MULTISPECIES: conjugative transfer signal peptidase TraF [Legionella]|jgi:conjugative transfer signal peptidase TraF|uniref:conjugative transfer signal peptidase TraF n=1 Tax=Legionella TaxID=445 RepID=UPI000731C683|nr:MULTISPECIES: conjugative transfer signal peptidase TraF [Legionella]CZO83085.1 conjugal transfer peptidase TraF [Legionella pneumophila]